MIIYPYKTMPPKETAANNWVVGYSDNGWIKSSLFYEYVANVFVPHVEKNKIVKPPILFADGHKTHLTLQISQLCSKQGIMLIALYPNATRLLQPADIAAFKPLKTGFQHGILNWRRKYPLMQYTKENFAPLLSRVVEKYVKPETLISGFRAIRLCPFNSDAINYTKCIGSTTEIETKEEQLKH
nr:unnamed protein product [Callosobruchus analis]